MLAKAGRMEGRVARSYEYRMASSVPMKRASRSCGAGGGEGDCVCVCVEQGRGLL